jgi:hypothetical protein
MRNDPTVLKFLKAAQQRLTSAEILLREQQELDSTYLAGYGVECGLKAILLARTPRKRWPIVLEQAFQGRAGHNFENLKALLKRRNVNLPVALVRHLRTVSTWSTDLRYEVGRIPHEDAQAFFRAAKEIVLWVQQTL